MIVPVIDVVVGDLAVVGAGESFPADGLVVEGASLQVDESALTGEAFPVRKTIFDESAPQDGLTAVDAAYWGLAGTRVLTGEARLRIVATGADTVYGEIVRSAISATRSPTQLQRAIAQLVKSILLIAGVMCVILAAVRLRYGYGLVDALLSAVTLAIAAIPEEFPVAFTFFLGVGIYRLARRQALVRRAVVVENIGRVTCICSDKTGTLTEGQLRLSHCFPAPGGTETELKRVAALASRTESGDPLDLAILSLSSDYAAAPELLATYPFTEDRRSEAAVFRVAPGRVLAVVKGAPEIVLSMCDLTELDRAGLLARVEDLAAGAHKVIACASVTLDERAWLQQEVTHSLEFAGLLAFEDPVRPGVRAAVQEALQAGIRVIMITGDHPATARAIAKDAGIGGPDINVVEGDQIDAISSAGGAGLFHDVDVIARASPSQKLLLVRALQANGEVVAVTGDGVNDVPALQAADIGIAMGERGTRSAREVASIVLLDDNFRTIINAIAEGTQLFQNLRLSFAYLLMIHLPLVASAMIVPLEGGALLYLPIHIVWLELIIHPSALLAFQNPSATHGLTALGRNIPGYFFGLWQWVIIGCVGVCAAVAVIAIFNRSLSLGQSVEQARTMAMVVLIVFSAAITLILSGGKTLSARVVVAATLLSTGLIIQVEPIGRIFHLEPVALSDWALAVALGGLSAAASVLAGFNKPAAFAHQGGAGADDV
jgi:P-type Ca2+ transporter type 2C